MHQVPNARFERALHALNSGSIVVGGPGGPRSPLEALVARGALLRPGADPLAGLPDEAQLLWREIDILLDPDAPNPWEEAPFPASADVIGNTQVELFRHFGALFGAIAGMEHTTCTLQANALSILVAERESKSHVRDAVQSAIEDLADFYFHRGPAMRQHCMQLGGMKTLIDKGPGFERTVIAGIRKLCLYVDSQLLPDPFAPFAIESAQRGTSSGWSQLVIALRRMLQLEPLVAARLPTPPLLLFPSRQAFKRTHPSGVNTDVPQLWVQGVGIALGVPEPTQRRIELKIELEPDVAITKLLRAGILPNYGIDPDTMPGQCERNMRYQWSRSPQFSQRDYAVYVWALIRTTFVTQYCYFEELQAMAAHPVASSPYANRLLNLWNQFNADTVAMMASSKEAAPAVAALSHSPFKGLTNATVAQLVELLKQGENAKFREQLGSFTVDLAKTSAEERSLQASHLQARIQTLIQEYNREFDATFQRLNKSLLPVGATLGLAAVGLIGGLAPFISTLPWLQKSIEKYAKGKYEQRQALAKAQHSLVAVIASDTTTVVDL